MEAMCFFSRFLKMGKDSAAQIELGRLFHQMGTVNEKVSERDFVPFVYIHLVYTPWWHFMSQNAMKHFT